MVQFFCLDFYICVGVVSAPLSSSSSSSSSCMAFVMCSFLLLCLSVVMFICCYVYVIKSLLFSQFMICNFLMLFDCC